MPLASFQPLFSLDYAELLLAEKLYFCATLCLMQLQARQQQPVPAPATLRDCCTSSSSQNSAALPESAAEAAAPAREFEVFYKRIFFGESYRSPMTVTVVALGPAQPVGLKVNTYSPTATKTKGMYLSVDPRSWQQSLEEAELESPATARLSRQDRPLLEHLRSRDWFALIELFDMETVGEFYTCETELLRPRLATGHHLVFRSLDCYTRLWGADAPL